ncbi:MAG: phosphoesterase, partial [Flavobacteriaceae bacterium]|nr:phosphoesterase [Flavobacteriaceae bacterium]
MPVGEIAHQFFVLGNARKDYSVDLLQQVSEHAKTSEAERKYILFTGNNIKTKKKDTINMASQLDPQIAAVRSSGAKGFFMPGRHDWKFGHTEGLEKIEEYLEDKLGGDELLTPNNGCAMESVDINDQVHLLVIDSQWFIENWDRLPQINDKCAIKSREKLFLEVEGEVKKNADKLLIVAMYHPMFTNGFYGGKFSSRDHLFPLQGNIPLPGVASLITQIRSQGGISVQDRFNKKYNELMSRLNDILNVDDQRILLVSGHENNLQYIEEENIKQLISHAAGRTTPATVSDNGLFSYGKTGYATVDLRTDGSVWTSFYAAENTSEALFTTEVYPPIPSVKVEHLPEQFPATYKASVYK